MVDDTPRSAPLLPTVVAEAARRFGERPAFIEADGAAISYGELHQRSDEVAAGLARAGVGPGAVVALTLTSDVAYVVAYVAAAKVGAATAGINPRLTPPEQARALDVAEPALVLADAAAVHALAVRGGRPEPLAADPDRAVALVFTSGTTGQPKAARFTDRQLAAVRRIDSGDRWGDATPVPMLAATQFAHVGFTTKLPWYLALGSTTHLLRRWRAADVLDLVERERIATIGGVAPQVALLLRDPGLDQRDLSCVRSLVVGGAPSPPALVAEARRRFGAGYSIRYSSTESGGVGTGTALDAPEREALHTVGRPWPGIEVDVRDDAGRPVAAGEVGEVCLRSAAVMAGYWRDPEATAVALRDGWLHTGDLGRIDDDRCLVLVGRKTEMFIRGGYNVFPVEVEAVLGTHPGVRAVAVVPRADDVMGEIGVAVVVPAHADAPPTLDDLRAHAGSSLSHHKLPEDVVLVAELPLTAMQKLDRRALKALV
ncbi:MAG: AMP-dependent synthetase and ligase [Acidimicrobiales bacterium]|nr:AMP-dependent synthetase and ligase [Acidimicrobiales bacterium]